MVDASLVDGFLVDVLVDILVAILVDVLVDFLGYCLPLFAFC